MLTERHKQLIKIGIDNSSNMNGLISGILHGKYNTWSQEELDKDYYIIMVQASVLMNNEEEKEYAKVLIDTNIKNALELYERLKDNPPQQKKKFRFIYFQELPVGIFIYIVIMVAETILNGFIPLWFITTLIFGIWIIKSMIDYQ